VQLQSRGRDYIALAIAVLLCAAIVTIRMT